MNNINNDLIVDDILLPPIDYQNLHMMREFFISLDSPDISSAIIDIADSNIINPNNNTYSSISSKQVKNLALSTTDI